MTPQCQCKNSYFNELRTKSGIDVKKKHVYQGVHLIYGKQNALSLMWRCKYEILDGANEKLYLFRIVN